VPPEERSADFPPTLIFAAPQHMKFLSPAARFDQDRASAPSGEACGNPRDKLEFSAATLTRR
jgi:hypothetical protein